jgi:hypothetical protein
MGETFLQLFQKLGNIIPFFLLFFSPLIHMCKRSLAKERKNKVSLMMGVAVQQEANKAREERRGEGSEISQESANFLQNQLITVYKRERERNN